MPAATTPPPGAECGTDGTFARPSGHIPPGYVYAPTSFDGTIQDPQPDDTFAADARGHHAYTGRLQTRQANGREEFLVCAHVGLNDPTFAALSPFATPTIPANIAPTVIVSDAAGHTSSYTPDTPGLTDAVVAHYDGGNPTPFEGYVRMWVPFPALNGTASLTEPGFQVRVEIRGTKTNAFGGTSAVAGADEVQVHLGPPPVGRNEVVQGAAGVAADIDALVETIQDPGADDLQHILTPIIDQQLPGIVAKQAPAPFKGDWDASLDFDPFQKADANLTSISFFGGVDSMDLVPIDDAHTESKLVARLSGKASMSLTVDPVAVGIVSILSGTCSLDANLDVTATVSARLGLEAENDRPKLVVHVDDVGADLTSLHSSGTVLALLGIVPTDKSCSDLQDSFSNGIKKKLKDGIADALKDGSLDAKVAANLDPHLLESADLLTGPFAGIRTMQDGGFAVRGWSYQPTATDNVLGDHLLLWDGGLDVAANGAIADLGGDRFPYSARPSTTESVAGAAHERRRPDGSFFDLGAIISGASVNQLARAATAGSGDGTGLLDVTPRPCDPPKPDDPTPPPPCDPPVTVRPSSALQYVPNVPTDWPTTGAVQAFIPSLRLQTPVAEASTMAADVYIGVSSHIDTTTNQVAFDRNVVVRPRFLRLAPGTEIAIEHDPTHVGPTNIEVIGNLIKDGVGQRVQDLFQAIQVPDLSKFLVTHDLPPMTLSHLSLGTVGGGNLGVYVDVDPAPTQVSVSGGFDSPDGEQPSSVTLHARTTGFPQFGSPVVRWHVVDGATRAPVYDSPWQGEAPGNTSLTLPTSGLYVFVNEPCTGQRWVRVIATATVTQAGVTDKGEGDAMRFYMGPPNWDPVRCGHRDDPPPNNRPGGGDPRPPMQVP